MPLILATFAFGCAEPEVLDGGCAPQHTGPDTGLPKAVPYVFGLDLWCYADGPEVVIRIGLAPYAVEQDPSMTAWAEIAWEDGRLEVLPMDIILDPYGGGLYPDHLAIARAELVDAEAWRADPSPATTALDCPTWAAQFNAELPFELTIWVVFDGIPYCLYWESDAADAPHRDQCKGSYILVFPQ